MHLLIGLRKTVWKKANKENFKLVTNNMVKQLVKKHEFFLMVKHKPYAEQT